MNPHEWIVIQRRRQDLRDAGFAVVVHCAVLVVLIGGGMVAGT